MRLLHPETLAILAEGDVDFSKATSSQKQTISHAWSEVIKFKATNQKHPKMFIDNDYFLGVYMNVVKLYGDLLGCKFNPELLEKYPQLHEKLMNSTSEDVRALTEKYFDDNYLFSDTVSLYFKGVNIFPNIFGHQWRKYIPVESYDEILRQINKTTKR